MAHHGDKRYVTWLVSVALAVALGLGALLLSEFEQKKSLVQQASRPLDSVNAMAHQAEREFLRFRQAVALAEQNQKPVDPEALNLRHQIFLSRLELLQNNPSIAVLSQRPEYLDLMPELQDLAQQSSRLLSAQSIDPAALTSLAARLDRLGPAFQALGLAATSVTSQQLAGQADKALNQQDQLIALTLALLLLLLLLAGLLFKQHMAQRKEQLALQALTRELSAASLRAEESNRSKSLFLANMSHELRTPFNGFMGMLEALRHTRLDGVQASHLETAQKSAQHLLTLLNDILDISALQAGKISIRSTPVGLGSLLRDIGALMEPLAAAKGLGFDLVFPAPEAPWVLVDETRLKQVLFNLVNNAIKFTDQGKVSLGLRLVSRSAESVELEFEVTDTGIGIAQADLARLFTRFQKAEMGPVRDYGGAGLGLEISQSLAHLMGGKIKVRSRPGHGSSFSLHLRLETANLSAVPRHPAAALTRAPTHAVPSRDQAPGLVTALPRNQPDPAGRRARVLLVEDNSVNRQVAAGFLQRLGCLVSESENGQQALEQLHLQEFDLVLMDINMPVMDGLAATRAIRAMAGQAASLPVLVLTADAMAESQALSLAAGANGFLTKPLQFAQLQACVEQYTRPTLIATPDQNPDCR